MNDDYSISPKIRQMLLHWGYELTKKDFKLSIYNNERLNNSIKYDRRVWEWKWKWEWEMRMKNENEKWESKMRIKLWINKKNIFIWVAKLIYINYYWFNRQEILEKAKQKYSKGKAAEYYKQYKEAIKEKSRERYKNLSREEKDKT